MKNYFQSTRSRLILLAVAGVLVILLIVNIIIMQRFRVIGTDPSLNLFSAAMPTFTVNFNKELLKGSEQITSSSNIVASYKLSGDDVVMKLNSLSINKTYVIEIDKISSVDNKSLSGLVYSFTAKNIPSNNLPKSDQQAILNNQDNYKSPLGDPIVAHLPYETPDYELSTELQNNKLIINAQILLDQAESNDQAAAIAQIKQEINTYIQSLGLDPSKYDIQYTVLGA